MEVPVLLLEFEGVIADTTPLRTAALAEALAADGIALNAELIRACSGHSVEGAVRTARQLSGAADDPTALELCRLRAERAFAARAGKGLALQPGVHGALDRLSSVGRLALVTTASRREVEFVINLGGLDARFRPVITVEVTANPKPAADPYEAALSRVGELFPGQVLRGIAVENSLLGVRAARAAGLLTVIVGDVPPQVAMEADSWVETLADLTPERVRSLLAHAHKSA